MPAVEEIVAEEIDVTTDETHHLAGLVATLLLLPLVVDLPVPALHAQPTPNIEALHPVDQSHDPAHPCADDATLALPHLPRAVASLLVHQSAHAQILAPVLQYEDHRREMLGTHETTLLVAAAAPVLRHLGDATHVPHPLRLALLPPPPLPGHPREDHAPGRGVQACR